MPMATTI
nr:4.8 kDa non-structural protein [Bovine coronavirus]UVC33238.1 4.8 kDa non-structural protein [Bovine coronavirus]UVC33298.1 4.8 kDa non-structural protein [Bovine coronavirus]UVC33346.1 4.8 kDa non-structural protein [Bovine coronavirus]UVC33682.1 4.8 kDa non-structural protein [Bovine coronavirus]